MKSRNNLTVVRKNCSAFTAYDFHFSVVVTCKLHAKRKFFRAVRSVLHFQNNSYRRLHYEKGQTKRGRHRIAQDA